MRMIRSFLPVGQGAFYCEQFDGLLPNGEKVNVVYDCGSSTDVKLVEEQIRATFDKNETIHAVFISHLHDDHINGLKYLLEYCKVKNIFFPLMNEEDKKIVLISNYVNGVRENDFTNVFIINPRSALESLGSDDSQIGLYPILSHEEDIRYNEVYGEPIHSGQNVNNIIVRTKKDFVIDWCFIPFNFKNHERVRLLKEKLGEVFGLNFVDIHDLPNLWKENKEKIQEIYCQIPGGHNTNSMTLYSGPIKNHYYQFMNPYHLFSRCCKSCVKSAGCLYTGDYDASGKQKWKSLKDGYLEQWNAIGCLQIPHHGSSHNYNSGFSTLNSFFVISAGRSNRYRHPHSKVVKNLMFNNCYPFIVTEDSASAVYLVVD